MKNSIYIVFIVFILASFVLVTSCEKEDACDSITCYQGGRCVDGTCDCTTTNGYEGEFCETEVNKKFAAFTNLVENCSNSQPTSVSISITPSNTSPTRMRIDGLVNGFFQADAFVESGSWRNFFIPRANFGAEEIEGNGSISEDGETITISYSIFDPGSQSPKYTCSGTITK